MSDLILILLAVDAVLIAFLTFGKGKKGALVPAVIFAVLATGIMFYNADKAEAFYIAGLVGVGVWSVKVGLS